MQAQLNRVLLAIAALTVGLDAVWLALGHFAIDLKAYGVLAAAVVLLLAGAFWYAQARREAAISATLSVSAFLVVFPAAASLLSYLILSFHGPRIDGLLARADAALGFHWPVVMAWAAAHPVLNGILGLAYSSVMPQTLVLILLLGMRGQVDQLYSLALALSLGALITLLIWGLAPSFGAFSVYTLPAPVASRLGLVLGLDYGKLLVTMLKDGPGFLSPRDIRGLVGFPSYHTLQALVLAFHARKIPYGRWAALGLNGLVLIAVPIHGGHHLLDMAGGLLVTLAALGLAQGTLAWARRPRPVAVLSPAVAG
jgi:hypothetical protein